MTGGRFLQFIGLVIVTFVMIRSYAVSDMAFQFGGLGIGAVLFVLGTAVDRRGD
ncbi:MAG: hypothetical protein DHS20C15_06240 [Planctomycetota bacterium]|nr:MAG: hypothetical protein DHS20C15_06240 [Planctomycetota bacterium]